MVEIPKSGKYIPLYYSNLFKAVPEGEEIIYSVYYKVNLFEVSFSNTRKIWHTHLLITTKGLYFGWFQRNKHPKVKFVSWLDVKKISRRKIRVKSAQYTIKPKREKNFETWREYRNRKKEISDNIKHLMHKGKEEFRTVEETVNLERNLRSDYKYGPTMPYVDIKKRIMKDQVNFLLLDLVLISVFLLPMIFLLRVVPYSPLGLISLSFLTYLGSLIFHRWRVRKHNFEIPHLEDFSGKEGKKLLHNIEYKEKQVLKDYKPILNQRMVSPDFLGKIAIFSDDNVGRSTLARDYLNSRDYDPHFIIGVNFARKEVKINNHNVIFQIWFLSNLKYHEQFFNMHLRGTLGAIIFYDITNINSLINVPKWIQTIKENKWILSRGDFPIILVGNKNDLERNRAVSKERGNELKEKYGLSLFMEVSLKTGDGVNAIFEALANLIFKNIFS